jgi:HEAT repeat protein
VYAAIKALGKIRSKKAVPILVDVALNHNIPIIQINTGEALTTIGEASVLPLLLRLPNAENEDLSCRIMTILGHIKDQRAIDALYTIIHQADTTPKQKAVARWAIRQIGQKSG